VSTNPPFSPNRELEVLLLFLAQVERIILLGSDVMRMVSMRAIFRIDPNFKQHKNEKFLHRLEHTL